MTLAEYLRSSPRGTATAMSKSLGVSVSYLSQMSSGDSPISEKRAVQIESLTNGQVSRKDIFPNDWEAIWPELAKAA